MAVYNIIVTFALSNKDKEFFKLIFKPNENKRIKTFTQAQRVLLFEDGSEHDIWINPKTDRTASVPRHGAQEVSTGTLKSILKALLG